MSEPKSWKQKSTNFTEEAVALLRDCVSVERATGTPTKNAIPDLAPTLGLTTRRARSLFYRDGFPVVLKGEWLSLRYRAGLFLLNKAARLRQLADKYEEAGETLVADQMEFAWECKTSGSQRRSA